MILAHKIRLYPNKKQATYLSKACGVARFAYNWALALWIMANKAGEQVTEWSLRKLLNATKRVSFPWMLEVTKCAPQLAIMDLGKAFRNYYAKRAGHPAFRKKGRHDSFRLSNDQFKVKGRLIRVPNLGYVRMAEELRFEGKIIGAAISSAAGRWYASIQVEIPDPKPIHGSESQAVDVDLGVKDMATLSDGTKAPGAKPHKALSARLRRLNKSLSRKEGAKKGQAKSKNFKKAQKKLSRLHARIADIRNDGTHKLTAALARNYGTIGIEDLNVSGMAKNHKLARAVLDMSFFEFRRQLEYKSKMTGSVVVVADRFFASSKLCSNCGEKYGSLNLSTREWLCPACGCRHDRDINAAINLRNYAVSYTVPACGELVVFNTSVKQELNSKAG